MNGAPGEADQGNRAKSGHQLVHGCCHEADLFGAQLTQRVDVCEGANWVRHDRSDPGHDVEVNPHGLEWQDDVGEENGRIHAVAAHRLHRDLDDQIGGHTGFQHPDAAPDLEVLRQGASGLTHEPHRGVGRLIAAGGAEECAVVEVFASRRGLRSCVVHSRILAGGAACWYIAGLTADLMWSTWSSDRVPLRGRVRVHIRQARMAPHPRSSYAPSRACVRP